jgi:hypothetical protein
MGKGDSSKMTTYRIQAPDGKTYSIEGPAGASDEQVKEEVIRQNPQLGGSKAASPVVPEGSVNQIPTERGANLTPSQPAEQSFADQYIRGPIEAGLGLATGAVAGIVAPPIGIVQSMFGGKYGTQAGVQQASDTAGRIQQAMTRAPRGDAGQEMLGGVGEALGSLAAVPLPMLDSMGRYAGAAARNPKAMAGAVVAPAQEALAARSARQAEAASNLDYQNAPRIDAAQKAQALPYPISLVPSESNPTLSNKAVTVLTGRDAIIKQNEKVNKNAWANNAKAELGIDVKKVLNKETFDEFIKTKVDSYEKVAQLGELVPTENTITMIRNIEIPDLIAAPGATNAVKAMVTNTIKKIGKGMNGAQALSHIKTLRKSSKMVTDAEAAKGNPGDIPMAKAQAQKAIADMLEGLVDDNIATTQPGLVDQLRSDRTQIAKAFGYKEATNLETGLLDPTKLSDKMTGVGADMRNIAANYPEVSGVSPTIGGVAQTRLSRSGIGASVGIGAGIITGIGPFAGAALGAGAGEIIGGMRSRQIATPKYQAKNALPADRRIRAVEPVAPVEPAPYSPNFQFGDQTPMPDAPRPGMFARLPAPSDEGTRQMVLNEQNRQGAMSRTLGQQAEASQAAAEAAASYGQRRAYQAPEPTVGQALPVEPSVKTAASKVAAGQQAFMTAAEKVAWSKTKVDLQESLPALKALDSKALATKLADRIWVQETITKAKEKARGFAELEARAANMEAQRKLAIDREKMEDVIQQLQDTLQARPTSRGGQGPVTRGFKAANATNTLDVSFGFTPGEMRRR